MVCGNQSIYYILFNISDLQTFADVWSLDEIRRLFNIIIFIISDIRAFGDVWPIEQLTKRCMSKHQPDIVKEMGVLIRMEVLEKCEKEKKKEEEQEGKKEKKEKEGKKEKKEKEGKKEKKGENRGQKEYESEDNEGMKEESKHHQATMDGSNQEVDKFHGNLRKIEEGARRENVDVEEDVDMKGEEGVSEEDAISDAGKFECDTTTEYMRSRPISPVVYESIPDRVNLIDLLCNEGCISIRHKQQIEQQPTQQLQNIEMFQLIKNGSIKTLKLVNDYFIRTGQRNVFEMVNKKYHIGGKIMNMLITTINHRGSRGVGDYRIVSDGNFGFDNSGMKKKFPNFFSKASIMKMYQMSMYNSNNPAKLYWILTTP